MPISDSRDRFFYPHYTDMKDTYTLNFAVTLSKSVATSTTVNTTGVDFGLVSELLKTTEKGIGSTRNIQGPTTASGSAIKKPIGIYCIKMFSSYILFKLGVV